MTESQRGERCPAKSKRTGERCRRWVPGGGPCRWHGGAAPRVEAARQGRILVAQASSDFPTTARTPGEALLSAVADSDAVVQALKQSMAGGMPDPLLLDQLGGWLDRVGRLGKVVVDARVEDYVQEMEERQGQLLALAVNRVFDRMGLHGEERARAGRYVAEELRRMIRSGEAQ